MVSDRHEAFLSHTDYVCGFAFFYYVPERAPLVFLIRKNRPSWQAGLLNGIGGKIEPGETPRAAMTREFREEADVEVADWQPFCVMNCRTYPPSRVFFMRTVLTSYSEQYARIRSATDESVGSYKINPLPPDVISNLRWLIPLALDEDYDAPVRITERPRA